MENALLVKFFFTFIFGIRSFSNGWKVAGLKSLIFRGWTRIWRTLFCFFFLGFGDKGAILFQ